MVRYMDLNREFHEGMATGILARVIQHELDHVHGKLFIDYLDKETLESFRPILAELEAGDHKEIANSV
ncbi:MAG: peptide deformylase, partial [Bacteroidetes bacterium]|nr:peptide deformylase [Bacteroidota bacterium]